jgi:hypothetical protein
MFMLLMQLRNKGVAQVWLRKIPMPILIVVLIWICNNLIFIDRAIGWILVKDKYCTNAGVTIHRKIPKNAFLILEPLSVSSDFGRQTLEEWIKHVSIGDGYEGDFAIQVVSPIVFLQPRFAGDISLRTTLTWRGKPADGVCLHMRKIGQSIEEVSECGDLISKLDRPIVRVREESPVGINEFGIFNVVRYSLTIFDENGPYVEVRKILYGGGWLAKTIPPGDEFKIFNRMTHPISAGYSCAENNQTNKKFGIGLWFNYLSN